LFWARTRLCTCLYAVACSVVVWLWEYPEDFALGVVSPFAECSELADDMDCTSNLCAPSGSAPSELLQDYTEEGTMGTGGRGVPAAPSGAGAALAPCTVDVEKLVHDPCAVVPGKLCVSFTDMQWANLHRHAPQRLEGACSVVRVWLWLCASGCSSCVCVYACVRVRVRVLVLVLVSVCMCAYARVRVCACVRELVVAFLFAFPEPCVVWTLRRPGR
jgi:hypothetical protein